VDEKNQWNEHPKQTGFAVGVGAIVIVPLLAILLIAIHLWTFVSSSDPGHAVDPGYGDEYVVPTTDPVQQATGGFVPDNAGNDDSPTQTTTTGDDPATEAAAITNILQQAQSERQSVVSAVNDAINCGSNLAADEQALATAQSDRQQLAQSAADTQVDALDGASAIPQALSTALSDSATADGDFAQWAGDLQNSCSPGSINTDPNYAAAQTASTQADQDKQSLLSAWNPIAQQYGQQTWSISNI
jgi:hypothetical protein